MRKTVSTLLTMAAVVAACASQPASRAPTGEETFVRHCASCHGARGDGTGPVAAVISGTIPNLTTLSLRHGGAFPADYAAGYIDGRSLPPAHGSAAMPVWGTVFAATARLIADAEPADSRVADIVEYLRSIQR